MIMANVTYFRMGLSTNVARSKRMQHSLVAAVKLYFPIELLKIYRSKFISR